MKLPSSVRNWTSIAGASLAVISIVTIAFLFFISMVFDAGSSYLGIFIWIILPVFLVIGLVLIPTGMWITHRKQLKSHSQQTALKWPVIDFNSSTVRNATIVFITGTLVFLMLTGIGSYEAFHYTESVEFCGTVCHKVMEPEYVAYHESSHERVKCVECHVGSGADWYVKSKLSGLYQIYSVMFDKYPRPIPTPLHNLRPARETCEECHWTEKFYEPMLRLKRSYLSDYDNTEWDINLMMKTSATYSALGLQEGIHWHINPDVHIEYQTDPDDPNIIPWVRYTNLKTGEVQIYKDSEYQFNNSNFSENGLKTMDCIDCHNRPSHNYQVPQNFIDDAITAGEISRELPDIKYLAMEILGQDYPSRDSAFIAISVKVTEYYESMYDYMLESHKDEIEWAILAIQMGYRRNIFPEMKVKWNQYPNHLGHLETNGCYRCHSDRHITEAGKVITRECTTCHNILAQGEPGNMEYSGTFESLEFKHPIEIGDAWQTTFCSDCHFQLY
ncbi:MAG: NapC/NirT family cytochrome c [Bacteroidales bacterium]|nr:NapC/NirT family cytochrome c [Bacteroidales bacterium]